jgi:osmoprotectant transport system ATP-binding protein
MIHLREVSKSFLGTDAPAVDNLTLEILSGETLVLLGSSGCGKTTTLKMINRLIEPTHGLITIDGADVRKFDAVALRRSIGYVFQGIGLFPHLTIEDNVAVPLRLLRWASARRRDRVAELLDLVGLSPGDYGDRLPDELSGGQQQRVAVARALAGDPSYLLMDEPFGALDAVTRDSMQQELLALKKRLEKTIVFVTHDILEALILADRVAVLHDGRLQQVGPGRELVKSPASPFVADLFRTGLDRLTTFQEFLG